MNSLYNVDIDLNFIKFQIMVCLSSDPLENKA